LWQDAQGVIPVRAVTGNLSNVKRLHPHSCQQHWLRVGGGMSWTCSRDNGW